MIIREGGTKAYQLNRRQQQPPHVPTHLHEPHPLIPGPALAIVVPHDVLVVRVGVLREVPLDEVSGLLGVEAEEHEDLVHVSGVQTDWVSHLCRRVPERQILVTIEYTQKSIKGRKHHARAGGGGGAQRRWI